MKSPRIIFSYPVPLWTVFLAASGVVALCVVAVLAFPGLLKQSYVISLPETENSTPASFSYGAYPKLQNAEFFRQVRDSFVAEKATFIEANLASMQLRLYQKGEVTHSVPILTKGKEGSWWETPAGLYKAQTKEKNHFSSFGSVYMPSSIQFQGNFFIHGWPYHPGGTPVESTFSGGCIRLSAKDAEEIYREVEVGAPILVHEQDYASDDFAYEIQLGKLTASGILVADLKSNFVITQREPGTPFPVASITKLLAALVATEYINIEKELVVPQQALAATTKPRLEQGQRFSLYSLLYPLLEESSNEAAETISASLGSSYFVNLMNEKAKAIGMANSAFQDASGLDPENISSAEDLFYLAKYLLHNRSFLLGVSAGKVERPDLYGYPTFQGLENFNLFTKDPGFVGGKIGKSKAAKETLLAIFELQIQGETRPIAIILLGSQNVAADAQQILERLRNSYGVL